MGKMHPLLKLLEMLEKYLTPIGIFGGGVWLAVLGEWDLVKMGGALLIVGPMILFIPFLIGQAFPQAIEFFKGRGFTLGQFVVTNLKLAYDALILTGLYLGLLIIFLEVADSTHLLPIALWTYGWASALQVFMQSLADDKNTPNLQSFIDVKLHFELAGYMLALLALSWVGAKMGHAMVLFFIVVLAGKLIAGGGMNKIEEKLSSYNELEGSGDGIKGDE